MCDYSVVEYDELQVSIVLSFVCLIVGSVVQVFC